MVTSAALRDAGVMRDAGGSRAPTADGPARQIPRSCARPGCPATAEATLRFAYAAREAVIEPLEDERRPQTYDLCGPHAARTRPPHGWTLRDVLPSMPAVAEVAVSPPTGARDPVALLAAAFEAAADVAVTDTVGSSTG
jgi:hypothetical protein